MMFQHVAVEEPEPGVVGDKDEIRTLAGFKQIGVTLSTEITSVLALNPEMMAVQVHRMIPSGVVVDLDAGHLIPFKLRKFAVMVCNLPIKSPGFFVLLRKFANRHEFPVIHGFSQITHGTTLHMQWNLDVDLSRWEIHCALK
jgi:hypothetical protein